MSPTELKSERKKLGINQWKLSKAAKVSRYNIALFETNCRKFTEEEEKKIKASLKREKEKQNARNR